MCYARELLSWWSFKSCTDCRTEGQRTGGRTPKEHGEAGCGDPEAGGSVWEREGSSQGNQS